MERHRIIAAARATAADYLTRYRAALPPAHEFTFDAFCVLWPEVLRPSATTEIAALWPLFDRTVVETIALARS
jgi:hypothetical protein